MTCAHRHRHTPEYLNLLGVRSELMELVFMFKGSQLPNDALCPSLWVCVSAFLNAIHTYLIGFFYTNVIQRLKHQVNGSRSFLRLVSGFRRNLAHCISPITGRREARCESGESMADGKRKESKAKRSGGEERKEGGRKRRREEYELGEEWTFVNICHG